MPGGGRGVDKVFKVVFQGYEIRSGAQVLDDGRYAPTLLICRDRGDSREEHSPPVPGPNAFLTADEAREHAFEHGMHWVKDNS
jgi:hypothetical protein